MQENDSDFKRPTLIAKQGRLGGDTAARMAARRRSLHSARWQEPCYQHVATLLLVSVHTRHPLTIERRAKHRKDGECDL